MLKSVIGMHAERGFTLIEILVVVLIIGITLGFTMLAFGDFGAGRKAVVSAEQFSSYIQLVQQRALFEANTLGVRVSKDGYETYHVVAGTWQPMPTKSIFHRRDFPDNVLVNLNSTVNNAKKFPILLLTHQVK